MSYYEENQKQQYAMTASLSESLNPQVRNREIVPSLKAQRQELVARIQKIDTLLGVLEKNPDFVKMFDLARELV